MPTIEDHYSKVVTLDGYETEVEILDTPGSEEMFYKVFIQEQVKQARQSVVVGSLHNPQGNKLMEMDALILLFDITKPETFKSMDSIYKYIMDSYTLLQDFAAQTKTQCRSFPSIVVAGSKNDMEEDRKVHKMDAERYASDKHCPYTECSSLTLEGVSETFEIVIREHRK